MRGKEMKTSREAAVTIATSGFAFREQIRDVIETALDEYADAKLEEAAKLFENQETHRNTRDQIRALKSTEGKKK